MFVWLINIMNFNEDYINSDEDIRREIRKLNRKLDDLNDISDKDWFVHKQIKYIRKDIRKLKNQLRSELDDDDNDDFDEQINISLDVIKCSSAAFFICLVLLIIPYSIYDFDFIDRNTMIYIQIFTVIIFIILSILICNWNNLYYIDYN